MSRPRSSKRLGPSAGGRGYTVMEVMASLGILAVGASGVIALQKTAIVGNRAAQNLVTANAVATTWLERLRADGVQWNGALSSTTVDDDTTWLKQVKSVTPGAWFVPDEVLGRGSPRADVFGTDIYGSSEDNPAQAYCAQVRLTQLYPTFVRAEVRVFWSRAGSPVSCDEVGTGAEEAPDVGKYGAVYATSGILMNTARLP